ncbi:hypothetical protein D8B26_002374 [Coccidioides posadasii str. Silveira]|uniref:Uncharacterized protein n=3 Tax=Coccidioides posadasii TaxID=199306 RepID=E9DCY8_COCPS|nr:hypothetical protein CPC735_055510 [Coccidioides posadasii C735 delta SOWgp]EER24181.1 hypothetical protein CPC735_055510 [Coccidioides posadasii C735 delta SOWgp]EFW15513.1 conserved hypothetical protein [Coccidioides posadasii str. Silveira]KMM65795.1 hypothetical protein CPAG_02138 [Coccidioides posadasii RMSCC 3488]QVM07682.1 hypothetical protein D8B26_002374 [Coccidioides posadasii str. Silveira]|eukprot:XP_003066326.1 hypothetical protein CPC735_055510 [Coccidioides posadasii C735 delta SOWgp]
MAIIRYQPEELLRLRESPLVIKPDNLPPIEEWMGPIPDPTAQKKNPRDPTNQLESANNQRRPSFFESRHISRTSNSEDLVLGPPKTSFASATRGFGKSIDATDRSFKNNDHDDTKQDRFGGFRDKFFKDREYGDRDKDPDRRDNRTNLTNGRRMNRDDREDWNSRPRRNFGLEEDRDRRSRRSGDGDRWDGRDSKEHRDQQDGGERVNRDRDQGRFPGRRDTPARQRHDQFWHRDGESQDTGELEEDKTPIRNREWRRGLHGPDRDWNRPVKQEQDPEWMDSTARSDTKEAHTQEDFQRWKERMKAGAAQVSGDTKKEVEPEPPKQEPKTVETKRVDGEMFSSLDPSFQTDAGLDNFFGLFGGHKATQDSPLENLAPESKKETPKPVKSSRFAGFFNTQNEAKEAEPPQSGTPRPASTDADQEGFQRILQMLGGNKSRNATPQVEEPNQPRPPLMQIPQSDFAKAPPPATSPLRETFNRQEYMNFQDQAPRDKAPPGLENLLAQKAPKENNAHGRDTEFLLRLMQQSKLSTQTPTGQNPPSSQGPAGRGLIDLLAGNQGVQVQKNPVYIDDPAIANFRQSNANDPRNQLRRRPTGGPTGYFDEMPYPGATSGNHTPSNPPGLRPQGPPQQPMNIQRPPGLEHVNPNNWPNQQIPQQSNQMMLPPGLPAPQTRNINANFSPAHPMPLPAGMTPSAERPQFQRGASGNGPTGFAPPPGIMPPPGYLNMNAPPPSGFPLMPHSVEAMMNLSHGHPGHYGAGPQQGPHQPSSRQLLEMFTQHGGNPGDGNVGARSGAGMMGPAGPYR